MTRKHGVRRLLERLAAALTASAFAEEGDAEKARRIAAEPPSGEPAPRSGS